MPMNNVLKQASKVMMGKTNTTSNRKVCKICLVFTQLLTVRILTKSLILILLGFWTWGFLQLVKGTQKLYSLNVSHCSFFSNLTQRPPAGLIMPMQYHQSHFSYLFFVRTVFLKLIMNLVLLVILVSRRSFFLRQSGDLISRLMLICILWKIYLTNWERDIRVFFLVVHDSQRIPKQAMLCHWRVMLALTKIIYMPM